MAATKTRRSAAALRPDAPPDSAKMQEVGDLCLTALLGLLEDAGASAMVIGAQDDATDEQLLLIVSRGPSAHAALFGVLRAGLERVPASSRAAFLANLVRQSATH